MKICSRKFLLPPFCGREGISGFTLIEMLLALSIFSIIALGLYGVFWNAIQINQRSKIMNGIYREARWSMERMAKDLENMVSYHFGSGYPNEKSFKSEEEKIVFVTVGKEGLKVVSYYLEPPESVSIHKTEIGRTTARNEKIIMRYERKENVDFLVREEHSLIDYLQFEPTDSSEKEVLSIHIKNEGLKFLFAYRERSEGQGTIVWNESWNENYLPYGVRVEMTFVTGLKGEEEAVLTRDVFIPTGAWGEHKIELGT